MSFVTLNSYNNNTCVTFNHVLITNYFRIIVLEELGKTEGRVKGFQVSASPYTVLSPLRESYTIVCKPNNNIKYLENKCCELYFVLLK